MKRFEVVYKDDNGILHERVFFGKTTWEIKAIDGFVAITASGRVKHPSPEVMQLALLSKEVDLAEFYTLCENINNAIINETEGN